MGNGPQLGDKPHDAERRRHTRQDVLFSSAELEKGNDGVILNISEGGVALHALSEITTDHLSDLRLQLSLEQSWIEVKGKVVWRSPSRKTVGVQFVDLAASARERIKTWISGIGEASSSDNGAPDVSTVSTAGDLLPQSVNASTKLVGAPASEQAIPERMRQTIRLEIPVSSDDRAHKRKVSIALVGSVLLLAIAYFSWPGIGVYRSAEDLKIGTPPARVSPNASNNLSNPALNNAPSSTGQLPAGDGNSASSFVLQVAAIKNENNAITLASQLSQKQFPAFVVNSPGSDLYRVLVGPYSDTDAAVRAEADLRREGFSSIRQKNTPAP